MREIVEAFTQCIRDLNLAYVGIHTALIIAIQELTIVVLGNFRVVARSDP